MSFESVVPKKFSPAVDTNTSLILIVYVSHMPDQVVFTVVELLAVRALSGNLQLVWGWTDIYN